ncbi:MAG: UDP-N-acetylmuramoyl-L-alanyl-D-glutamate--2,6-diaminopimelate ligase [Actinobacteria bacterium]|nr:MAG: UDP-N-acetylmuramoyl-L-alanyl-D-glutamate--2,6-diaminopimelate ligase [Actinomycetota bacterium]
MKLERLIAALGPTEVVGRAPVEIRELAYDSREVPPGALFFCIPGAKADGHDFARQALSAGAAALVVERALELDATQLLVPSVREAMPRAAVEFFGDPTRQLDVVGVTGTSGKTTTVFLLRSILEAAGRRPGLLSSIERRVGNDVRAPTLNTPEAIDLQRLFREMLEECNDACVLEATSIASSKGRLDGTRFAALVFTNLSQDHLDFHGTMEEYFEAKRRLFAQAQHAIVNVGDEYGRRLAGELPGAITFRAGDALDADLRLPGSFNVENALGAAAAARALGVDEDAVRAGIEAVHGVPGRFEPVDEGQPFAVIVDYSHKPGALETVLREARALSSGRVLCVFGAGGDRDREKRPVMGRVAAQLADVAIVTSDNPRSESPSAIAAEIVDGLELDVELDRRAAIERAIESAGEGDVVVIAGKGHEQGQEFADRTIPFDDREVARAALRNLKTPA